MRAINWTIICVVMTLALATSACAQREFVEYPEFRYTSALPGGGWGVTPDGVPGFEGAIQTNIPVAQARIGDVQAQWRVADQELWDSEEFRRDYVLLEGVPDRRAFFVRVDPGESDPD